MRKKNSCKGTIWPGVKIANYPEEIEILCMFNYFDEIIKSGIIYEQLIYVKVKTCI